MRRVMVVGQPGAGKSTFAQKLGARTGLPVVHIDKIHWQPGWIERSKEEKTRLCLEVHARDSWIFEGGHSCTWPDRLARCDTLIWIDVPLWLRTYRVLKRTILFYGSSRPDMPDGCTEQFSWEFYTFIWRTRKSARSRIKQLVDTAPTDKTLVRLTSISEADRYLAAL